MAESLGEKLREAREERDISISEVAEQTRISALYLEAIENDDYRTLPGGIFNKGFVKSFAKYVGVDEHEALRDYAQIVSELEASQPESQPSSYRPQVLTDDSRSGSMVPTIIFAVLILGLMAWGILALVKYVQSPEANASVNDTPQSGNVKPKETPQVGTSSNSNSGSNTNAEALPATDSIKVKISTTTGDLLSVTAVRDGRIESVELNSTANERILEANKSLKLSYYKGLAEIVALEVNGRKIETPVPPANYNKNGFEYEITLENIKQILKDGRIDFGAQVTENAKTNPVDGPGGSSNTVNAETNANSQQ